MTDLISQEEYDNYVNSVGEEQGSYKADLDKIDATRKLAYGAEQEEFLHSVLFTHGEALYDSLFSDMTYGESLRSQENERQKEILKKYPEMQGVNIEDEDGVILSGRLGSAFVDPVTWLVPWTKLGKAATITGTMAKSGAVGGAFVGADVAAREIAYKGEDASLGTIGTATAIGAIAPTAIAGATYKLFPRYFQDELAKSTTDANRLKADLIEEQDVYPALTKQETSDVERVTNTVVSPSVVSSSSSEIANIGKELEVLDGLSTAIFAARGFKKNFPKGSESYKKYEKKQKSLQSKKTKLEKKVIRGAIERYIPEKSKSTIEVLEKLKSEGKLTEKIMTAFLHEATRPIVGGIGGLAYGGILGDEHSDTILYGSIGAGAAIGFLSRRLETSKTLTDLDIKTGKLILRNSALSNLRSSMKVLTASTTSTRLDAYGGWNKLIGNMLFNKFGSTTDSVESRTIRNQSYFLGEHAKILDKSLNDETVNKVAGEVMRGYVDLDSLSVGYKGITGSYSSLTSDQLSEVKRIVPELTSLVNKVKVRMQETGIKFDEIEDYGLPQLWDLNFIDKNPDSFLADLDEALKIQVANQGKKEGSFVPVEFSKRLRGIQKIQKHKTYDRGPFERKKIIKDRKPIEVIQFRNSAQYFENQRTLFDKEATRYMAERGWINLNAQQAVGNYGLKSIKVADFSEAFGANGEVINEALNQIQKAYSKNSRLSEKYQEEYRDQLIDSIEAYWGVYGSSGESRLGNKFVRLATSLANMSYLTTVTIANLGDLLQPFINSGFGTAAKTFAKRTVAPGSQKFSKLSHFKYDQSWEREYSAMITKDISPFNRRRDFIEHTNNFFFRLVGLQQVTNIARNFAYDVGVNNAYSLARKGVPKSKKELKRMEQLGLNVEDLEQIRKYDNITDAFESSDVGLILDKAGRKSADRDAIIPTVGNRLLFTQTNNPFIRPLGQFLSWAQAKSAQVNELVRRVEDGDMKLALTSLATVPIYAGFQTLKEIANPEFRSDEELATLEFGLEKPYVYSENYLQGLGKALSLSGNYSNFAIDKFISAVRSMSYNEGALESVAPSASFLYDLGVELPKELVKDYKQDDPAGAIRSVGERVPIVSMFANYAERIADRPIVVDRKAKGGEITNVPNAPEEPDERIDKMTGMPYDQQAGTAFVDEEDPLRRLGFVGGGEVDPLRRLGFGHGGKVLNALRRTSV